MTMTLSSSSRPRMASCAPGTIFRPVELSEERLAQDVVHQRALARAAHAGYAREQTERETHVDLLEIVLTRTANREPAPLRRASLLRHGYLQFSAQIPARERFWAVQNRLQRPGRDKISAVQPGPGPEIDDVVGGANRVLIVLDDDDGVAQIAQALEGVEQPMIVALVQSDARFVENVKHADKSRADLRGQPNPLRFAAGERVALPVQREVRQADVFEEGQPGADFLDDFTGHMLFKLGEFQRSEEVQRFLDAHPRHVDDRLVADGNSQAFRSEARTFAVRTLHRDHELLQAGLGEFAVGFLVKPFKVWNDAFERLRHFAPRALAPVGELDFFLARTVEQLLLHFFRQVLERNFEIDAIVLGQTAQEHLVVDEQPPPAATPRRNRAVRDGFVAVGHDQIGIEKTVSCRGRDRSGTRRRGN